MRTRYTRRTRHPAMTLLAAAATSVALLALSAAPALANSTTIDNVSAGFVTSAGASVSASVTPDGDDQAVTVNYGTSPSSLTQTVSAGTAFSGGASTVVATLGGLTPSTNYYFDVVSNASGDGTPVTSATGSFTTLVKTTPGAKPNVANAISYLTSSANLIGGTHYEYGGGFGPDYGDTINAALGLAAAGSDNSVLQSIVDYLNANGSHYAGPSADFGPSPGASGKLALLAEAVGDNPRSFAGQDLIAELDSYVCTNSTSPCDAPGEYADVFSTFSQAFGILAQLRAGDTTGAASPISYLESLQEDDGAWSSAVPSSGASDVDSTAMAAIALSLVPSASAAVTNGDAFIASRQAADGGFAGASGDSVNSTALALIALGLEGNTYSTQISHGLEFLAAQQNSDGGFNIADGESGSDLIASSQTLGGAVGTSFGTLLDSLTATTTTTSSTTTSSTSSTTSQTKTSTSRTTTTSTTKTATHRPTLTHVSQSNGTWRPSSKLASLARKLPPVGTTFGFTLNEPATVTFTFTRRLPGRKVGHLCDTPTRSNRTHPRCTITLTAKLTAHGLKQGANRLKFYGRLSRHVGLGAGTYTVAITATAAGRTSSAHRLTFTVA